MDTSLVPDGIILSVSIFRLFGRIVSNYHLFLPLFLFVFVSLVNIPIRVYHNPSKKLPYLQKNNHDVRNVHKLDFLIPNCSGFCVLKIVQWLLWWTKGRYKFYSVTNRMLTKFLMNSYSEYSCVLLENLLDHHLFYYVFLNYYGNKISLTNFQVGFSNPVN